MTARRTPHEDTLLAYAAGTLREGPALVVATHLALSPDSRRWVGQLEEMGGAVLEDLPPSDLDEHALQRALARIEGPAPAADETLLEPLDAERAALPAPLRHYPLGPWIWAGRGTRFRRVMVPPDGACRVIIFSIDPKREMPSHAHSGMEYTCVISGSYCDETGRFGPGDFEEADEELVHQPVVDSDVPCVCVVALDGAIRLQGLLGRLLQPFVRI